VHNNNKDINCILLLIGNTKVMWLQYSENLCLEVL